MMELVFGDYTREFLNASALWLADDETRELTNTPVVTADQREAFYKSLPSRTDYKIWGISYDGMPVGACGLKHMTDRNAEYWGYIGEKKYWGKGLGRELLLWCVEYAKKERMTELYLYVTPVNERAIRLYERFGFMPVESNVDGLNKMLLIL